MSPRLRMLKASLRQPIPLLPIGCTEPGGSRGRSDISWLNHYDPFSMFNQNHQSMSLGFTPGSYYSGTALPALPITSSAQLMAATTVGKPIVLVSEISV